MEDCDNILLIQAEFDNELDAADAAAALRHRENCAVCREAYDTLQATHSLLQAAPRHRASDTLRRALSDQLGTKAEPVAYRPTRLWWRNGMSFALGTGLAAAVALLVVVPAQQSLIDQVVDDHVRALQPGHLEDVISTDKHTVKPWFDGRADFAPPVKDLAAEKFPLLGGRLDYVGGHQAAAMVYGRDKHLIDLFVWPAPGNLAPAAGNRNGYNAIHWTEDGMTKWAVSDLEASQLREFVERWRTMP
jgi:anti-sigma factor RsiW